MTYSSIHMYIYICIKLVSYLRKSFLVDWVCVPEEAFVGEPPKKVKVLSLAKLITVCMGLKFRNLSPHTGINWQDHCNIMLYIYIYIGLLSGFGRATSTKHFQGQTAKSWRTRLRAWIAKWWKLPLAKMVKNQWPVLSILETFAKNSIGIISFMPWVVLVTLLRSGGKDMKLSQQYPQAFGREVANLHLGYMSSDPWDSVICNILVYFTSLSESIFLCASHRRLMTILIMVSFELWVDKQKHQNHNKSMTRESSGFGVFASRSTIQYMYINLMFKQFPKIICWSN